jgi:hypothetical protein
MGFSSYFRRTSAPASGVLEAVDLAESVQLVDDEPQAPIALAPVHGFEDRNTHPGGNRRWQGGNLSCRDRPVFRSNSENYENFPGSVRTNPCSFLLRPPKTVKSTLTHNLKQEHAALATVHYPDASR